MLILQVPLTLRAPEPAPSRTSLYPSHFVSCRSCDYIVPEETRTVDGKRLGLKPGARICLSGSSTYSSITFTNLVGSKARPIIITNCGGTASVTAPNGPFVLKVANSRYFRISGGRTAGEYGIRLYNGKSNGLVLGPFASDFQVDHLEIFDVGFAGVMAKTEPSCDAATHRDNFTMRNVVFEHNYIHDTGGEGFYIGHTAFSGASTPCGTALPHLIENIDVRENIVHRSGWDGIQVSCAVSGARIYKNRIENYATERKRNQSSGICIGSGTSGICHSNLIRGGHGPGIIVFGLADNYVYNNIILNPEGPGIFCDERTDVGRGYFFFNNTIIQPDAEGMKLYSDQAPITVAFNNIIVKPGLVNGAGKSISISSLKNVKLDTSHNFLSDNIAAARFIDPAKYDFRISASSPLVNRGRDISGYLPERIKNVRDFYGSPRIGEDVCDIGAAEYHPPKNNNWFRNVFSSSRDE